MRVAKVVGQVTLNRCLPAMRGGRYLLVHPYDLPAVLGQADSANPTLVAYDERGARDDDVIALAESREAAAPFHPRQVPVDAYNAAILDDVSADQEALK